MDALILQENTIQYLWDKMFQHGLKDLLQKGGPEQRQFIVDALLKLTVAQVEYTDQSSPTAAMVAFSDLLGGSWKELAETRSKYLPDLSVMGTANEPKNDLALKVRNSGTLALKDASEAGVTLSGQVVVVSLLELAGCLANLIDAQEPDRFQSVLGEEFLYSD